MENTTTPAAPAAPATVEKIVKKQFTINTSEKAKKAFEEFCNEFSGPSKSDPSKPKFLSSHEGFDALWEVATNRRFEVVKTTDENGELVFDEDGQPVMETIDHLEIAAKSIIAKRDEVDLQKQVEELEARLELLKKLGWSKKS